MYRDREICLSTGMLTSPRVQSISGWLSKNCDENSRMCKISYSKFPPKGAHAQILVAIFGQPTGNRLIYLAKQKRIR